MSTPGDEAPRMVVPVAPVGEGAGAGGAAVELPCSLVVDVDPGVAERWLIDQVWAAQGVGLIGGQPKTGKTWLALDLAVSVASGTPALGTFPVPLAGPVLIYPAEDRPGAVRGRIEGLCQSRGLVLAGLPIHIVTAESLRLDEQRDRVALEQLLGRIRPALVVLDPLVRLHGGDENSASHISEVLGYLRVLQRRHSVAIIVTHHVSKRAHAHPGQALRGSSDLHAWGDSNLYLHRQKGGPTLLTVEHRFAQAPDPLPLRIAPQPGGGAHLEILAGAGEHETPAAAASNGRSAAPSAVPLPARILAALKAASGPLSQAALRRQLQVNNQKLTDALRELQRENRLENLGHMGGWRLSVALEGLAAAAESGA